MSGAVPPGLRGHTATLIGSKIFLYGGNPQQPHATTPHLRHCEWTCVASGYDGRGRSNDLYILDPKKLVWEHPAPTDKTPAGRQRHTACLVGSKKVCGILFAVTPKGLRVPHRPVPQMFVLGGFDGFKWLNDLHVLDVAKLEETEITSLVRFSKDFLSSIAVFQHGC